MRELTLKTLVNFRIDASVLSAFDNACYLTGSNRTQILRQLISTFTAEAGATLPKQISEQKSFEKALKNAVRRSLEKKRALAPPNTETTLRTVPRRSFTEFINQKPAALKP